MVAGSAGSCDLIDWRTTGSGRIISIRAVHLFAFLTMNKSRTNKDSILAITLLFLLLFLSLHKLIFIYLSIGTILLSFLSNAFTAFLNKAWSGLGEVMGKITGPVILSLVFFLLLFPMSLLLKLLGKDNLQIKMPKSETNFEITDKTYSKPDLQNPY